MIVFTNVSSETSEFSEAVKKINALCLKISIENLHICNDRNRLRKIYLSGNNEDENLRQALLIIAGLCGTKYDNNKTEIYVSSDNAESEALLNSENKGEMKVRRIVEGKSLAHCLVDESIFNNAVTKGGEKRINILVVGMGKYGLEIFKELCWCCQMPGYALCVHVFDEKDVKAHLASIAPELIAFSDKDIPGEAHYSIRFYKGDVASVEFTELLSSLNDLTGVYISLGNDNLNIETAMKVRMQLSRKMMRANFPPISTMIQSASKMKTLDYNGLVNMNGESYEIAFVDVLKTVYSLEGMERNSLEDSALKSHLRWAATWDANEREKYKFNNFEYFRRSSMAKAKYAELRSKLGYIRTDDTVAEGRKNNEILREYEHRRWNTYMRTEGYVYANKKDHIAKTHPLLIPYNELPEEERIKDDL